VVVEEDVAVRLVLQEAFVAEHLEGVHAGRRRLPHGEGPNRRSSWSSRIADPLEQCLVGHS
jgi:hypothetical protein